MRRVRASASPVESVPDNQQNLEHVTGTSSPTPGRWHALVTDSDARSMVTTSVFVSYSTRDRDSCTQLRKGLEGVYGREISKDDVATLDDDRNHL